MGSRRQFLRRTVSLAAAAAWHQAARAGPGVVEEDRVLHGEAVHALVSAAGGAAAASAGDHALRLWDFGPARPRQVAALEGLTVGLGGVSALALAADGKTVGAACHDRTVRVYAADGGRLSERTVLREHIRPAWSVALARDGKLLAAGDDEQVVWLWDLASGKPTRARAAVRAGKYAAGVTGLAFGPAARLLTGVCGNGEVRVWDVGTKRPTLKAHLALKRSATAVACAADGQSVAVGHDRGVTFLTLAGKLLRERAVHREHTRAVTAVAFSPDGRLLAATGEDGRLVVWDWPAGDKRLEVQRPGKLAAVAWGPASNGCRLLAAGVTGVIHVLRLADA